MARFVELSAKFSKSEKDIFTEEEIKTLNGKTSNNTISGICDGNSMVISSSNGTLSVSSTINLSGTVIINGREIYVDEDGNVKAKDPEKPLTRGERLEANTLLAVKARAVLLDEYDEYTKLRTSLNTNESHKSRTN